MTDFAEFAVLIVDDEQIARDILQKMFEALQFRKVAVCADGFEAIDQMQAARFDLAVIDVRLGTEDGLQVAQALRRLDDAKAMRVLIITAGRLPETMVAAKRAGADDILLKPFTRDTLQQRVEKLFVGRV